MRRDIREDCRYIVGFHRQRSEPMKQEEIEKYLDEWGAGCHICNEAVSRDKMTMIRSLVPLTRYPYEDEDGAVTQHYMVCPSCLEAKVLV